MSIFGNTQEISLNEGQMISDILPLLEDGVTLLKAPTGTGKSTFVMQTLMAGQHVVMLCPKVSQVQQLESMYQDKGITFCHGKFTATQEELSNNHIVATYDQLPNIEAYIRLETIFVVDEVHQLYSAGNYRGKALSRVIDFLQSENVKKALLMSATITEDIFSYLDIAVNNIYQITQEKPVQRQIILQNFAGEHELNSINLIINRVKAIKATNTERILLVRLNDIKKANMYKYFLERQGISALVVNRSNQGTEEITCMLESNMLSIQYSVIFMTSVWDEAINIMNPNEQIDSLHILGCNAHVDEITQFIGRTRIANSPVYIHLDQNIDQAVVIDDLDAFHQGKFELIAAACAENFIIFDQMAAILQFMQRKKCIKAETIVNNINNALKSYMKMEGLGHVGDKIIVNNAAIAADAFAMDVRNIYSHQAYLSDRLAQSIHNSVIVSQVDSEVVGCELEEKYFDFKQWLKGILSHKTPNVAKQFLINTCLVGGVSHHGKQVLQTPKSIPYSKSEQSIEFDLYYDMAQISAYICNMHDILNVLETSTFSKVKMVGLAYQNDPIIKAVMDHIAQQVFLKSDALKIYDTQMLEKLINNGLKKLDANNALKLLLGVSGNKFFRLDEKLRVVIKPNKAVNFVEKFSQVIVKNSKKPYEKKVVTFVGLGWSGYQFCGLQYVGSSKPQWIELNGCKLDARSGQVLNGILVQSVAA